MTAALHLGAPLSITRVLLTRNVRDRTRLIAVLSLAAALFAVMVGALYPSIGVAYDEVLDDLPAAFESMLGGADFSTPEGFLHVELFSFLAPALVIAAAISVGAGALAGAEQSGRLALVTACPLARSHIVSAALGAVVVAATAVAGALFVGILVGAAAGGFEISVAKSAASCFSLALLGIVCGAIAVAAGAARARRGAAVAAASFVAVASYGIDAFFPLSSTLEPFAKVSLWYPTVHGQPIVNGVRLSDMAVLAGLTLTTSILAYWLFERRDLT